MEKVCNHNEDSENHQPLKYLDRKGKRWLIKNKITYLNRKYNKMFSIRKRDICLLEDQYKHLVGTSAMDLKRKVDLENMEKPINYRDNSKPTFVEETHDRQQISIQKHINSIISEINMEKTRLSSEIPTFLVNCKQSGTHLISQLLNGFGTLFTADIRKKISDIVFSLSVLKLSQLVIKRENAKTFYQIVRDRIAEQGDIYCENIEQKEEIIELLKEVNKDDILFQIEDFAEYIRVSDDESFINYFIGFLGQPNVFYISQHRCQHLRHTTQSQDILDIFSERIEIIEQCLHYLSLLIEEYVDLNPEVLEKKEYSIFDQNPLLKQCIIDSLMYHMFNLKPTLSNPQRDKHILNLMLKKINIKHDYDIKVSLRKTCDSTLNKIAKVYLYFKKKNIFMFEEYAIHKSSKDCHNIGKNIGNSYYDDKYIETIKSVCRFMIGLLNYYEQIGKQEIAPGIRKNMDIVGYSSIYELHDFLNEQSELLDHIKNFVCFSYNSISPFWLNTRNENIGECISVYKHSFITGLSVCLKKLYSITKKVFLPYIDTDLEKTKQHNDIELAYCYISQIWHIKEPDDTDYWQIIKNDIFLTDKLFKDTVRSVKSFYQIKSKKPKKYQKIALEDELISKWVKYLVATNKNIILTKNKEQLRKQLLFCISTLQEAILDVRRVDFEHKGIHQAIIDEEIAKIQMDMSIPLQCIKDIIEKKIDMEKKAGKL